MKTTRLAAVVFSKIADFDSLLAINEQNALRILAIYSNLLESIIAEHEGSCVDKTGDEYLLIFSSAVHAVQFALHCKLAVDTYNKNCQDAAMQFKLCTGIHLGEIWQEEHHVYGNGINVAARVMQAAQPGMILVSEDVERQVSNKLDIRFSLYQHETFKNIERPLVLYAINTQDEDTLLSSIMQEAPLRIEEPAQPGTLLPLDKPFKEVLLSETISNGVQDNNDNHSNLQIDATKLDTNLKRSRRKNRTLHYSTSGELRETIQKNVANAIKDSMLAMKYAKKIPLSTVNVTDTAIEIKYGNSVKKIKRKKSRAKNESDLQTQQEALQDELAATRGTLIGAILKCLAALGVGTGIGYVYLSSKNWFWLATAIVAGLLPALNSFGVIGKSIEKIVSIKQQLKAKKQKKRRT